MTPYLILVFVGTLRLVWEVSDAVGDHIGLSGVRFTSQSVAALHVTSTRSVCFPSPPPDRFVGCALHVKRTPVEMYISIDIYLCGVFKSHGFSSKQYSCRKHTMMTYI